MPLYKLEEQRAERDDEIARLRADLAAAEDLANKNWMLRLDVEIERDALREALEWYANESNYNWQGAPMTPYENGKPNPNLPLRDGGLRARAALAPRPPEGNSLMAPKPVQF